MGCTVWCSTMGVGAESVWGSVVGIQELAPSAEHRSSEEATPQIFFRLAYPKCLKSRQESSHDCLICTGFAPDGLQRELLLTVSTQLSDLPTAVEGTCTAVNSAVVHVP